MRLKLSIKNIKTNTTVFFYVLLMLLLISGGTDDSLRILVLFSTIIISIISLFLFLKKKTIDKVKFYILASAIFIIFFSIMSGEINITTKLIGNSNYDNSIVAELKLILKVFILLSFFPITNNEVRLRLTKALTFLIVIFFLQVLITSLLVNFFYIPINDLKFIFPLIGGVAEHERYPFFIFEYLNDFQYYRPRFFFNEPSGVGYSILIIFFTRELLGAKKNIFISFLTFGTVFLCIAKAAIIILIFYFITKLLLIIFNKNRFLFILILISSAMIFLYILNIYIGEYLIWRIKSITNFDIIFENVSFFPNGVNSDLWRSLNDGIGRNFTYTSIFYELGIIFALLYLFLLIRMFLKLFLINYKIYKTAFPIFVAFLTFLCAGNNYMSGGALIILFLLIDLSKNKNLFVKIPS